MSFDASVHAKAVDLARLAIDMTAAAGSGHPTSGASLAHLVTVLLYHQMRYDPSDPTNPAADQMVLSEGHACPIIYAAAADLGMMVGKDRAHWRPMTWEDVLSLRAIDSPIDGHPNPAEGFPFFPAATGSLGQGLSISAGIALAARLDGLDKRIYCLIGDGESREGQVWEAADFILDYALTAVCPILNCNGYGQADAVSPQQSPVVVAAKLEAYGFDVRMIDGHNPTQIRAALEEHASRSHAMGGRPFAIVAKTIKGWGFLPVERGDRLHGKAITGEEQARALAELERTAQRIGAHWEDGDLEVRDRPQRPPERRQAAHAPPVFSEALERFGMSDALEKGKLAPRKAYGIALRILGHCRPDVVALDGDVRNSTFSEYFHKDSELADRFFECRIAEQNMVSCAVGLAAGGKIPFVSTFGKFMLRACDQFEMAMITRSNIKLVGSHAGANIAADGPSQMALADIGFFRSYTSVTNERGEPALYLLNPADAYCAYGLTLAMAAHQGACYLRAMRPDVALLYGDRTEFTLGGHHVLSAGKDLLLLATGYMVHEARDAVRQLASRGVRATLVDLYSLPLDQTAIARMAEENGGKVLTVEDNYGASMGSAVADALTLAGGTFSLKQLYVNRIPKSGRATEDELRYLSLTAEDIVEAAGRLAPVAAPG